MSTYTKPAPGKSYADQLRDDDAEKASAEKRRPKKRPSKLVGSGRLVGHTGAELIAAERRRQMSVEGWTTEHDAKHRGKQLAKAASSYLDTHAEPDVDHPRSPHLNAPCWNWPWSKKWWKPSKDPVRNLVKAGALIAAEIDRLLAAEKTRRPNVPNQRTSKT